MSEIRRVDPRRPIVITPQGLRRIVLGQVGVGELSTPDPGGAPAGKVKPRRLLFRERLRTAHLERDLVREPIGPHVQDSADDEKGERQAGAAEQLAEHDEQSREGCEQDRGPDASFPG